jgi:hypothetical protein
MTRVIADISVCLDGFVTTGLPDAVTAARERAEASSDSGEDLDAIVLGGGAPDLRRPQVIR